jgi:1-acyl-sn-glycerol-3-phosphate acyltransferase
MIIKSKHNFIIYPYFRIYTILKIWKNFHRVVISGELRDKNLPVLLLSNHVSWWDGIWVMYLNIKYFNRKFHFMMLEDQIKKFRITNQVGGYSVKKGSRSIIETLRYTNEILSDKGNLVLIFPQGDIQSVYNGIIRFEKGVEKILRDNSGKIQVFLIANLVDYFSKEKPTLFIYFKELTTSETSLDEIEKEYNTFYSFCISENISKSDIQ